MHFRLLVALILVFASPLWAQESESRMKIERESENADGDDDGDDVDDLITNPLLRAESGSKSRFSIASVLNYNGGTLNRPFSAERPNIYDTTGTTDWALMEGQISGKWNMKPKHSFLAGVGIRLITPFEKKLPAEYGGDRLDADNPYLMYQHVFKWSGFQSVLQVQPIYFTNSNLVKLGYVGALYLEQDNMMDVGNSKLSLGFALWAQLGIFNEEGPEDVRDEQSDYQFGIDPALEYALSDRFNFRWSVNLANFEHLRSEPRGATFHVDKIVHSMGLGISVTRDIFLYPNVQFMPEKLSADRTNVGLHSNINLF